MRKNLYKVTFWYADSTDTFWVTAYNKREALYIAKQYISNQDYISYEVKLDC